MIPTKRSCKLPGNRRTSVSYDKSQELFLLEAKRLTDKAWLDDAGLKPAGCEIKAVKGDRFIASSYLALSTEAAYTIYKELELLFDDHREHLNDVLNKSFLENN